MKHNILSEYLDDAALDEPIEATAQAGRVVSNIQPRITQGNCRIAIIGEAPGAREEEQGVPFVGPSGQMLSSLMSKANIIRDATFIGNVCQVRPPANNIHLFSKDGPEITSGLKQLEADLDKFHPNICVLLGGTALWAATGETSVGEWRGAVFSGKQGPFLGRKCIASYHPAAILRMYSWKPLLQFDLKKARLHADSPVFNPPYRNLEVDLQPHEIIARLEKIKLEKPTTAVDIEGYVDAMSCISLAPSKDHAFMVPFTTKNGITNLWDEDTEYHLWKALIDVLEDPDIPKVLQNSLYDRFVLQYSYGIVIRGVVDDTMLKHWELYCELEKNLGTQASIYTDEPPYKMTGASDNLREFWIYGCKDSAVTHEINQCQERRLDSRQRAHYKFNRDMLNPLLYMEVRGIKYNYEEAVRRGKIVLQHVLKLQQQLDTVCGVGLNGLSRGEILNVLQEEMCFKRDRTQPKKNYRDIYPALYARLLDPTADLPLLATEIATECDRGMNIKSSKFKEYLYGTLKLPVQYKRDPKTGEMRPSTDYGSLLRLSKKTDHPSIRLALEIGELRTRGQMLHIKADPDGRIRCGYNEVGTETGRVTCYKSPTGSGYNLQTIPDKDLRKPEGHPLREGMRDLFRADDGNHFFQCDLSGADGWTVAAYLAMLGDTTMLLDLKAGIKPAKVLCYLLRHGANSLRAKPREEILQLTREVSKDAWDYFACKIGQHGTSYMMGCRALANNIFIQSEGKVNMSEAEARDLQRLFTVRYRVQIWHTWLAKELSKKPTITTASGHTRRFFGRSTEILGEALAHAPQNNTTYVLNLAIYRLWSDPTVREGTRIRIEPLHQVHDALCGQFRKEVTSWATDKIKSAFNNEVVIAGQRLVIPFEGNYGPSWGELGAKYGGGEI